jgi:hypothetical protein
MQDNNNVKYDLTGKKIIPLNAPIGFANSTPPTTLPFQAVEKGQSVSEGLCAGQGIPYYEDPTPPILEEIESLLSDTTNQDNESSVKINKLASILKSMLTQPVVNPNAVPTTLKMMLDMYNTISQPVALLSMGATPEWSQSVIDNNNGYPKDFVIREFDTTGYFVYYQSLIDNNMNIKPTLASYVGWGIVGCYKLETAQGTVSKWISPQSMVRINGQGINIQSTVLVQPYAVLTEQHLEFYKRIGTVDKLLANYSSDGAQGGYFKDVYMNQSIGDCTNQETPDGDHVLYLAKGSVIIIGTFSAPQPSQKWRKSYPESLSWASYPLVGTVVSSATGTVNYSISNVNNTGFDVENFGVYPLGGQYIIFGKLASYVGDELAKIRKYKSSFYYDDLPEDKKLELRQYYIALDETKDLTKVTAPKWLEAELEGKELT